MALLSHFGYSARDLSGARGGAAGENIDIKLWINEQDPAVDKEFSGVEVKKVGGIDARAKTQAVTQAKLYGHAVLTDNLEWRFYREGDEQPYSGVNLMHQQKDGSIVLVDENIPTLIACLNEFKLQPPAKIKSSGELACYMAEHAVIFRDMVAGLLKEDENGQPRVTEQQNKPLFPELYALFTHMKSTLRPQLTTKSFADMYAQTIVYGLFIARYNDVASEKFDRSKAVERLRDESTLLNRFFEHITNNRKMHSTIESTIDKLCLLYERCDLHALLDGDERGDTIVHFYEDFLTHYDPALRKEMGVFYTPVPVVRYLVSMVDKLLIEEFDIKDGLRTMTQCK